MKPPGISIERTGGEKSITWKNAKMGKDSKEYVPFVIQKVFRTRY